MKQILLFLNLLIASVTASAQSFIYLSPLSQTEISDAEDILPNGILTNPDYGYLGPYTATRFQSSYLITPSEMQAIGFVDGDQIANLSWTINVGQQNQSQGVLSLALRNTLDTSNIAGLVGPSNFNGDITIPAATGSLNVDFQLPFNYTGGGIYVEFTFTPTNYSGWNPTLQTGINTNLTDGYRIKYTLGGEYAGYTINEIHSKRPITTLGKLSCIFSGFSSPYFTENTVTLAWQGMGNYDIEYGPRPYLQGTGGTSISSTSTTNENTYVLTNLAPGTAYDIYMRKICNATESSEWKKRLIGTSNSGSVTTFPYLENFDSGVAQTIGWENVFSTGLNWGLYGDENVDGRRLGLKDWMGGINHKTTYSRPIQLTAGTNYTISFDYSLIQLGDFINSENSPNLDVILTTSPSAESATILSTISQISNSQNQTFTTTFTAPTSGIYYVGLKGLFNQNPTQDPSLGGLVLSGINYLHVDNFSLDNNLDIEDKTLTFFSIYPNPTSTFLNFSEELKDVLIYDSIGRIINSYVIPQERINVDILAPGNYILQGKNAAGDKIIKHFLKK